MVQLAQWYQGAQDDTEADRNSCPWCGQCFDDGYHVDIGAVTTCYNVTPPLTV